jgi:hypothetical protein
MVTAFVANMFGDRWMYLQITGYLFTILALVVRGHAIVQAEQEELDAESEDPVARPATMLPA